MGTIKNCKLIQDRYNTEQTLKQQSTKHNKENKRLTNPVMCSGREIVQLVHPSCV